MSLPFRNLPLFIAWRYLRSKKSTNAINIIAWISVVAIAIVTAALVVVLSVFNGFERLVQQLYGDFYADVQVTPAEGKWMPWPDSLRQRVLGLGGIRSAEPVVEERAILVDQDDKSIVWLKGVSPGYGLVSGVPRHLVRGEWEVGDSLQPALVLGSGVENALQIISGQSPFPVTVYLPNRSAPAGGDITQALFSANAAPMGTFVIQQEFDDQYAFTNLDFVRYMLGLDSLQCSSVEIFATDPKQMGKLRKAIAAALGPGFQVRDRFQQNQSLFAAMQTEKLIIYAIAFLILVIAGFNIISSLTMTVLEKQEDMAVMRAMGATDRQVGAIFLQLGLLLAGLGAAAGLLLGLAICWGQSTFHWVKLAGDSFIIDYYPVRVQAGDLLMIAAIVAVIALIAGWLPAHRAARAYVPLR